MLSKHSKNLLNFYTKTKFINVPITFRYFATQKSKFLKQLDTSKIKLDEFRIDFNKQLNDRISLKSLSSDGTPPKIAQGKVESSLKDTLADNSKEKSITLIKKDKQFSSMLEQIREIYDKYPDYVVLTQVGGFYELYFEQAEKYCGDLYLALSKKKHKLDYIAFGGFPLNQLNKYVNILVKDLGYSVVIVNQVTNINEETSSKLISRKVFRVITPGTFIDDALEDPNENNFLLSIEFPENCFIKLADLDMKIGISWCDISTGELYSQVVFLKDLVSAISRINPKEIVLQENIAEFGLEKGQWYLELVELDRYFITYFKLPSKHRTLATFQSLFAPEDTKEFLTSLNFLEQREIISLRTLLIYLEDRLPESSINLSVPTKENVSEILQIDSRTRESLELYNTLRTNNKTGSLISSLKRTVTPSGTRLLSQWLYAPSANVAIINERLELVKLFVEFYGKYTKHFIDFHLKNISDISKIIQKFSLGFGNGTELLRVAYSLRETTKIREYIESNFLPEIKKDELLIKSVSNLCTNLTYNKRLVARILNVMDECVLLENEMGCKGDGLSFNETKTIDEQQIPEFISEFNWILKPHASTTLKKLHVKFTDLLEEYRRLYKQLDDIFLSTKIGSNLKFKFTQTNDFFFEVTIPSRNWKEIKGESLIQGFEPMNVGRSRKTFKYEAWTNLGEELIKLATKIREEESRIIDNFKQKFVNESNNLRTLSSTLDKIDVLTSFATLSVEKNLKCPQVDDSKDLEIINGRHLVVEDGLQSKRAKRFISNDCVLSSDDGSGKPHVWIITGPNMGGKSTFLRQNAIIVIMAQMGCFVPCDYARIGIVDKIFSRIGSADDLYNDMSTFMVEMFETKFILQGATNRSLAILDEVGRGTSWTEGAAISYGVLDHLIQKNRCKALFATHFGPEIQKLTERLPLDYKKIAYYKNDIIFNKDMTYYLGESYDYKLKPGVCSNSDALKVASDAGFPKSALDSIKQALNVVERK
ncbi:mismatch repair ATPase MSH1 SCDLUD_002881 [Saccharomycodes ludwigii]|uniref:mismatch repair ATPase MSH1 n=1 Tax=Saccharomycodes ludwigii TaxID=36035 RepID=UPI001E898F1F|nr:hypothetical protein SCDLUD_002881 [Saccharomycodes ludwigii]KAH3901389.1 hypothetical protein SCDLUD_002881 [Saccharomycodes ludwigii]